jgi:hypothetical protein
MACAAAAAASGESIKAAAVWTVRGGSPVSTTAPVPMKLGSLATTGVTRTDALAS